MIEIDGFLSYLIDQDVAAFINPVGERNGVITWRSPVQSSSKFLVERSTFSVSAYRRWLEDGQYSAILFDGSLLQITYVFVGGTIVGHRLAYIPCPFNVDPFLLKMESPQAVMDVYAEDGADAVMLRGAMRFDYDEANASHLHPASHLTLNDATGCRIPCKAPVRFGRFVDFVFRYFYPDVWREHDYLSRLARDEFDGPTITQEQQAELHITWR